MVIEYALQFDFKASNNQAEYEALIARLKIAKDLSVKRLWVFIDSQLVVKQFQREYAARDLVLSRYLQKLKSLQSYFDYFEISNIPRSKNAQANSLSHLTTSDCGELEKIFIEYLESPSIDSKEEVHQIQVGHEPSWIDPFIDFLTDGTLPADLAEARRLKGLATQYMIIDNQLYRKSVSLPLLKYLRPSEADYILRKVH
ncbi:uncharacterized protein [Elaeis guineensis]|uniref:uncharacterized protein n=1 Tax=Elaeis guineensis var. tenera TaxID=51953 RepID=UPI003C6D2DAD